MPDFTNKAPQRPRNPFGLDTPVLGGPQNGGILPSNVTDASRQPTGAGPLPPINSFRPTTPADQYAPNGGAWVNPAEQAPYRADAGRFMSDAAYQRWLQQQPLDTLREQTGIQTDAEKALAGQRYEHETASQTSAQQAQAALAAQQAAAEQALQRGGFAGQGGLLKQQGEQDINMLNRRAQLGEGAWQSRYNTVTGGGGGAAPTPVVHPGLQGDATAARAAAFARAKEQAGHTANAALAALKGMFEDRGTMGSSLEAARAGQIVGGAGAGVNEFTREQLLSDLARQAEIENMQYQGGITQRGQDLSARNALLALINSGPIY